MISVPPSISNSTLEAIDMWAGYYRANIHRFAEDVLHLELKLFQKILLYMMNLCSSFVFIASRGLGKTFLSAIFCVCRAILYPGEKIIVASGTRGQAINVLEKIVQELKPRSPALAFEIDDDGTQINGTNAKIVFKNGSIIKVVTAGESARGNRATVLLIDEFRLVKKDTVDTILKNFLINNRMPDYSLLTEDEKKAAYQSEPMKTLYLSSAYFSDSWAYMKCQDNFKFMTDEKRKVFVCGFPYHLSVYEGLMSVETVEDKMLESDFSEVKWSMEMEAEFFGSAEDAFFDFDTIAKNRRIHYPMFPSELSSKLNNNQSIRIQPKKPGEKRIISMDIALMASRKHNNDATAIYVNQLMPTKAGRYTSNIVYSETWEGMHTEDQALLIRKYFDEYECDYLVMDAQGVGGGVYDCLVRDINDPETGEVYPAISCCNNSDMADRCTTKGAPKVIWTVKASAQFNSECAYLLREAFRSGRIRLLITEYDAEAMLGNLKGYSSLNPQDKQRIMLPYIDTTLLIGEISKLQYEDNGASRVKLYERAGARKDRYSSLSYNYYVAVQLETKVRNKNVDNDTSEDYFIIRPPKTLSSKGGRFL